MHLYSRVLLALCLAGTAIHANAASIVIDNQAIPGDDIQSISIVPTTGNIFITTKDGYTVTKDGGAPPPPPPPPPGPGVAITSFTVTPSTIVAGESTTLSWTTQNATSCTPKGGFVGWPATNVNAQLPNGSRALTVTTAGTFNFWLTCVDANGGSTTKITPLTVTAGQPVPLGCGSVPLSGETETWKTFWLVDFPGPSYDNRFMTIPRTGYRALKFNTGNIVDHGRIMTIRTTQTGGVRLGSISRCPGDFAVEPECDAVWGTGGGLNWATDGETGFCQLLPNTDYYMNLTYTDGENANTSTCSASPCVTEVQHNNF